MAQPALEQDQLARPRRMLTNDWRGGAAIILLSRGSSNFSTPAPFGTWT
jgi:hypothetical protein